MGQALGVPWAQWTIIAFPLLLYREERERVSQMSIGQVITMISEKKRDQDHTPCFFVPKSDIWPDFFFCSHETTQTQGRPGPNYLKEMKKQEQQDLGELGSGAQVTENMRGQLVDWIVGASQELSLLEETTCLAVVILDRVLCARPVSPARVQLVALACLLVASKYEEIYYPRIEDLLWTVSDTVTQSELIKAELIVLKTLAFDLSSPTPYHFLRRFSKAAGASARQHSLTKYLIILSLSNYAMLQFPPSLVAASAVYLSRAMTYQSPIWVCTFQPFSFPAEVLL